jgi:hypothetical protein
MNTKKRQLVIEITLAAPFQLGATTLTFDNVSALNDTPLTSYGSNVSGLCASSGQPVCFGQSKPVHPKYGGFV